MPKIYGEVYGCSASLSDSQIMLGLLKQGGFEIVDSVKNSDLNLIVTCNVKTPTSQRMIYRIKELTKLNKPLVVAGCMPKTERDKIEKINPKASLLGPNSIQKIIDVANATLGGEKIVFLDDLQQPKVCLPRISKNNVIHVTQISTGCNLNCSYCIVKLAKGRLVSYPIDLIIEDVKQAVKDGCKEIWITSQDNASYNFNGFKLPDLLNKICEINGKFFVRIGMMNPLSVKQILDDLIDVYQQKKIFKFLHLPVQSFSDKVLENMNRGYTVKKFLSCVKKFRKKIPNITISTDIITGYPTETEKDYKLNIKFLEKFEFDVVNLSKFGVRPGTVAEKMEQIAIDVISKRSKELSKIIRHVSKEKNDKWLGWKGKVLVDEINDGFVTGRNYMYKPIVIKEKLNLGDFINVKIIETRSNFLIGESTSNN